MTEVVRLDKRDIPDREFQVPEGIDASTYASSFVKSWKK